MSLLFPASNHYSDHEAVKPLFDYAKTFLQLPFSLSKMS